MILNIKCNPRDWRKTLYIAKKLEVDIDEDGNEIVKYSNPQLYKFNYQPINSDSEIAEFGEKAKTMQKAVIPITYENQFKEFDVAYLNGSTPENETTNGINANYRLLPPRIGNAVIILYFERLAGK